MEDTPKFYPDVREYVLFAGPYNFDIVVLQRTAAWGDENAQIPGFEAQIKGNPAVWEYGKDGDAALGRMQITLNSDPTYYAAQRRS